MKPRDNNRVESLAKSLFAALVSVPGKIDGTTPEHMAERSIILAEAFYAVWSRKFETQSEVK